MDSQFSSTLESTEIKQTNKMTSIFNFEKISFIIFLIMLILTPLIFIKNSYIPLDIAKTSTIVFGILLSAIFYLVSKLKDGKISIPRNSLTILAICIAVSVLISSFLSTNVVKSLFGQGFEITTASSLLLMLLACFLVLSLVSKNKDRVLYVYGSVILVFLAIALFHIVRFFAGTGFMGFGIFNSMTSTLIGKWYDLSIFSGVIALLSLSSIQFLSIGRGLKIFFSILLVLSGFFLLIVNFKMAWICIMIVTLLMLVLEYKQRSAQGSGLQKIVSRLALLPLIVFIIAIVFSWKGDAISGNIIKKLKAEQIEVYLPWQLTIDVAADTIKETPLFGSGPNRFGVQYLRYKPQLVNTTPFWNAEFNSGFGFIPNFMITQGLVGALLWLLFIIIFFHSGIKALRHTNEQFGKFIISSSFLTAAFLWLIALVYAPSHSIILLMFVFTGIFLASLIITGQIPLREIQKNKFTFPLLVVFIIILAILGFANLRKTVALAYFQKGIGTINTNLDQAQSSFKKALSWDKVDIYDQAVSETDIMKINSMIQNLQGKNPDEETLKKMEALVTDGVDYAGKAVTSDKTNYYNYVAQARILEIATTLKLPNSYQNTKDAYINAIKLNPYNPALYLSLARLEASQNNLADSKRYIGTALQLKQDYLEAIFLLSQIQVAQGQIKDAITSVQVASQINPTNPLIFFQLGLLHYSDKNYQGAVDALTKAVDLNSQYANARYFLGLSYARLGRMADAVSQFEEIEKTNQDNQEVKFILSNLRAGRSPFADAQPPIDNKPEQRKALPVKEKK